MEVLLLTPALLLAPAPAHTPPLLCLHSPLLTPASAFTFAFMPTGTSALGFPGVVTVLDLLLCLVFTFAAALVQTAAAAAALVFADTSAFLLLAPAAALAPTAALAPGMGA